MATAAAPGPEVGRQIVYLDAEAIEDNPNEPRTEDIPDPDDDTRGSIQAHGILTPLWVNRVKQHGKWVYILIAGSRRLKFARSLGFLQVPCIVFEVDPVEAAILSWIENGLRKQLTPLQDLAQIEAILFAAKQLGQELSISQLARRMGKGKGSGWINNRLALRKLQPAVKELLKTNAEFMSACLVINPVRESARLAILMECVRAEWSLQIVSELTRAVRDGACLVEQLEDLVDLYNRAGRGKRALERVQAKVDALVTAAQAKAGTLHAPDSQTQARGTAFANSGGGAMSRGRQVTGVSAQEVAREVEANVTAAERSLKNALDWAGHSRKPLSRKAKTTLMSVAGLLRELAGAEIEAANAAL
jgi:ParB/RepB/Spo0J family partition protein